jgi:hypothetical protein
VNKINLEEFQLIIQVKNDGDIPYNENEKIFVKMT